MSRLHLAGLAAIILLVAGCSSRAPLPAAPRETSAPQAQSGVIVATLGQGDGSWDGTRYGAYPAGPPYWTVLKITLAPHTRLAPHQHPMINLAYIAEGRLTVVKAKTGERKILNQGEVLPEMVNQTHYGQTGDAGAVLIVFYAGAQGQKLSIPSP